ncbi:uncharacterized protein BXZ73DRAFT_98840 [Epithele typhae]|uniref:uncharacterized protein n=1 Tax=Epithele typhae TaxID=378194 RepID=UPI002008832C|nr:uncharacterized protein BXZ73DRAFT_98840 [Epithele typhae]KAH9940404.1 hypothetical protein BXZ73DRAFT_98840 [Epithele typhae]
MVSPTGLHAAFDSGPPSDSTDYTTIVTIHGYGWHSGIFAHLLPVAHAQNARVIAVNRRDYPGTTPYPASERALLTAVPPSDSNEPEPEPYPSGSPEEISETRTKMLEFARLRAHELLAFCEELVRERGLPAARPTENRGGIVLIGWSLGIVWMNAVLMFLDSFEGSADVDLSKHLRRVIPYDGPSIEFGFPRPPDPYDPFLDPDTFEGSIADLLDWVSGYWTHGSSIDTLARRTPAEDRPPTARTLPGDLVHQPPGAPGGSDQVLVAEGIRVDVFRALWEGALVLPAAEGARRRWGALEVRAVWCDRSTWEIVHAAWAVRGLATEPPVAAGRRRVGTVRIRGANHFAHWDFPADTLRAFLIAPAAVEGEEVEIVARE